MDDISQKTLFSYLQALLGFKKNFPLFFSCLSVSVPLLILKFFLRVFNSEACISVFTVYVP